MDALFDRYVKDKQFRYLVDDIRDTELTLSDLKDARAVAKHIDKHKAIIRNEQACGKYRYDYPPLDRCGIA